jgi:hypothetical protein
MNLAKDELQQQMKVVLDKECLCIGLSNAAVKKMNVEPFIASGAVNICPGPNIAYFGEIVSLQKMVNHIYGRTDIIQAVNRPHMFVKELCLYVDYWRELLADARGIIDSKRTAYVKTFYDNLMSGIHYYRSLTNLVSAKSGRWEGDIHQGLDDAENELKQTIVKFLPQVPSSRHA